MTPQERAEFRAEFRAAMPRILDGTEDDIWNAMLHGNSFVADNTPWNCGPNDEHTARGEVFQAVIEASGFSRRQLLGKGRHRPVVRARAVLWRLLWQHGGRMNLSQIGQYTNRDRSTVEHHLRNYKHLSAMRPEVAAMETRAREIIEGDGACE